MGRLVRKTPGERKKTAAAARRPTREELQAAYGKRVRDVLGPDLKVLFVGINPSLYTAAVGHHFGRPGNRFWPALHRAGITARRLQPGEQQALLDRGYGITNLVARATARADELSRRDLVAGGRRLVQKVRRYRPRVVAFLGITAYRGAFDRPRAKIGPASEAIAGAEVWVLPNPSGLNAHYQLDDFAALFKKLDRAAEARAG